VRSLPVPASVRSTLRPWWRPPRTLRPTREGWWYLATSVAVGVAATNTGNNLLYLVLSMMLAGIVVSGLLSEQCLRGVVVRRGLAGVPFAGDPARGYLVVSNRKRRFGSFSLRLREVSEPMAPRDLGYFLHVAPASEVQSTYDTRFARRGPARFAPIQLVTGFPFGLFVKATAPQPGEAVLVLPGIDPLPMALVEVLGELGRAARPVRGVGTELHDLRLFRAGDDPRLIHWKVSAKQGRPMVKEMEPEEGGRLAVIVDDPPGRPRDAAAVERMEQDIRFVASLAAHRLRAGGEVELHHGRLRGVRYRGEAGLLELLEYLARYVPPESASSPSVAIPDEGVHWRASVTVLLGRGWALVAEAPGEGSRLIPLPAGGRERLQ
jgi:uncharacterized protein (DUF58 family)